MRHERQVLIRDWNQDALNASRAIVVGCGSLGSSLAIALARLGVGEIVLVDPDVLEEHNLENQAYVASDLGKPKVRALSDIVHAIDPSIRVTALRCRIQATTLDVSGAWLFGCLDNVAARYYLNHLAVTRGCTLVDAGIEAFRGVVKIVQPGKTACQVCIPTLKTSTVRASCSSNPIPSTYLTASITANLQAMCFLRLLRGDAVRSHTSIDLERCALFANELEPNPKCEACGHLQVKDA